MRYWLHNWRGIVPHPHDDSHALQNVQASNSAMAQQAQKEMRLKQASAMQSVSSGPLNGSGGSSPPGVFSADSLKKFIGI